ncbi:1-acyl-sn-glycerol-3-phosphate acyltransferase [Alkalinema sp. FACHB-956]|uniref:lysophospholipid acyltransferase family protein n=1 Tax=Alkalinema sp. FACHB-956 TaxID=2692768 RepID=UPI001F5535AB|nr:1-acyl-sn-glycerol-3-phosphate acyltransferase [Alkalinema sp. FACHB-956]
MEAVSEDSLSELMDESTPIQADVTRLERVRQATQPIVARLVRPILASRNWLSQLSLHPPRTVRNATVSSRLSPWLAPIVYPLGHRIVLPAYFSHIKVVGQEHLPTTGPVILAPTHRSRWDAILVPFAAGKHVTGRHLRFMVTADEVTGVQGWFIRRLGGFPIDTKRPGISSLRHGIDLLEAGEMLVIFPEGNIFRDPYINPLKPGLARLALQAETLKPGSQIQIVPMHLQYSDPQVPCRTAVRIEIGPPLSVSQYMTGHSKQDARSLTADLTQALQTLNDRALGSAPEAAYTAPQH